MVNDQPNDDMAAWGKAMQEFDAVILGPMQNNHAERRRVPTDQHLHNMYNAIVTCVNKYNEHQYDISQLRGIKARYIRINIKHPGDMYGGGISHSVMLAIHESELAFVDISTRSPNVMYELAVLHSLGKRVYIFDRKDAEPLPFYLSQLKVIKVSEFGESELAQKLQECFPFSSGNAAMPTIWDADPITQFYGIPLVEAFETVGLASNYFNNFIHDFIRKGGCLQQWGEQKTFVNRIKKRSQSKMVILRPSRLSELQKLEADLKNLNLKSSQYKPIGKYRTLKYSCTDQYVVDFPSALKSLYLSPTFKRIKEYMKYYPSRTQEKSVEKQEKIIVDTFFGTLRRMADDDRMMEDSLVFMTMEQLRKHLP